MAITAAATAITPRGTPTPIPILDLVERPDDVVFSVTGGREDDNEDTDGERVVVCEDGEGEGVDEGEESAEV